MLHNLLQSFDDLLTVLVCMRVYAVYAAYE